MMAILRLCKISQFPSVVQNLPPLQYAGMARAQMMAIGLSLQRPGPMHCPDNGSLDLAAISPRTDDARFSAAVSCGTASHWACAAEGCWVGAWIGWRQSRFTGASAETSEFLRQCVLRRADDIPSSMDKPLLLAEVQINKPGVW